MFVKYSKTKIQQVFSDLNDLKSFVKTAGKSTQRHLENKLAALPIIKTDPDKYTLLRNRSISCMELYGPNQNADAFPEKELKEKYSTFKDCRVTVDHIYNDNPDNIIGIVLSSIYVEPQIYIPSENKLEKYDEDKVTKYAELGKGMKLVGGYIENLLAIDNERAEKHTPGLVEAIKSGEVTDTSMGCSVTVSICSVCGNRAETEDQFCNHIKHHKGELVTFSGKDKLAYEINEGIEFFEDTIVISEQFAKQSGKRAQAGGEGADNHAKVLEVISKNKKKPNITDFVKKSSYFGYTDDYITIGEEPNEYSKRMKELVDEENENEYESDKANKKLIINDRVVKAGRLLTAMKNSKNYDEFESYVSGIIGDELTTVSKIKCKSFYNNQIKKSNKQDLLALIMGYEKQNYSMDQIKRKLSELDYSKQDIADTLHAYQTVKDGYTKQANFDQLEDTNKMMDAYNTNLEDEGVGIKKDDIGQKPVVKNPLFEKISNIKADLTRTPDYVVDNAKEFPDEEKEETITKYNDDDDKQVNALRKKRLARNDDEDDFIEDDDDDDEDYQEETDFSEMKPINDDDDDEDEFFEIDEKIKKNPYKSTDEYGEKYDDKGRKIDRRKIKNNETLDLGLDWEHPDEWIKETFTNQINAGKSIPRAYFETKDMFRIDSGKYLSLLQSLVTDQLRKKNKMENDIDDFIELDDKISKLKNNLSAGVNTKDHLKQDDTLANGAGLERYDSIINKKERDFKPKKDVDLKNYKDYTNQNHKYLTEPNGVLKRLKDLKSSLNAEIEVKLKSQQERKNQFAFEYADDILDDSETKGNIEIDKKFSIKDIYRKLSEVMVPTQLQPGSTVTVKDKTTNTPEEQGTITNVKEQVTNDNKQETIIEMSDGKAYSTEDFNIDKTGMIQAIEDIDYDEQEDDKIDKIAIINDDNIDYDLVTPIEISDSDQRTLNALFVDDSNDSEFTKTAVKEEDKFKPLKIYSGNMKRIAELDFENEIFWED